jgi:molecular chaperone GrpE
MSKKQTNTEQEDEFYVADDITTNQNDDTVQIDDTSSVQPHSAEPTVEQLAQRIGELEEDLLRSAADVANIRRRSEQDKIQIGSYAKKEIISELLSPLDNLDRAIANAPEELKESDYIKGLLGVQKQLSSAFSKLGIEKIKTVGEIFNPETMEAVSVEGDGDQEIVSQELQPGYSLGDQNIRHATVRIIKK